jgi:hypothetical protein
MNLEILKWIATGTSIAAAMAVSLDLGRRATGWGFVLFSLGSVLWVVAAQLGRDPPLGFTNMVMIAINLCGVYRWLIRKAG